MVEMGKKLMKKKRRVRRIFAYDNNRIGPPGCATRFINRYCSISTVRHKPRIYVANAVIYIYI